MRAIGTFYYVQRWRSPTIVCSTYLWFATTTTKRKHLFCLHPALTELFLIQRSESSAGTSKPAVSEGLFHAGRSRDKLYSRRAAGARTGAFGFRHHTHARPCRSATAVRRGRAQSNRLSTPGAAHRRQR